MKRVLAVLWLLFLIPAAEAAPALTPVDPKADEAEKKIYVARLEKSLEVLKQTADDRQKQKQDIDAKVKYLEQRIAENEMLLAEVKERKGGWAPARVRVNEFLMSDRPESPLSADSLKEEWRKAKIFYQSWFRRTLEGINDNLAALQDEKDYGDGERRKQIKEATNKLLWDRDHIKRQVQELHAATAIDWVHLKNRIDEWFQKLRGKPIPQ